MKQLQYFFILIVLITGCARPPRASNDNPALEYSTRLKRDLKNSGSKQAKFAAPLGAKARGNITLINETTEAKSDLSDTNLSADNPDQRYAALNSEVIVHESQNPNSRDYEGPLALGEPGISASLWKESRGGNELFHDHRAFQPMDLITILITENSQGTKDADTDVKSNSTLSAAINKFFGFGIDSEGPNKDIPSTTQIDANTKSEFKGEGETTRKGSLTAKISAMVVEVLPSGILRIEGEKIISVNSEEEVMVISGLIRPRDIDSFNEVPSAKIADLRIDYYGRGTVDDVQHGGWGGRLIRRFWPF